jgi:tagatose 6-phosphate kinase
VILAVSLNPCLDRIVYVQELKTGTLNRGQKILVSAGGKGVNVAKVVAALEEPVCLTGFFAGAAGRYIISELDGRGVRTKPVWLENQETRTTVNIMDLKTGKETEITEPGPLIPPQKIDEFFETAKKAVEEASVVVLSGSLPKGVDPDIYKTLILFAKDLGKYTVLDASGQPLEKGIEAGPTAIKPNVREMGALMGNEKPGKEQIAEYCGRLREKGISYVCVSMGSEGAFLSFEDQIHFMKAFSVNAVNTIGCGDAMTAGLAVGLQRGYKPFDMLRFATACAASNATFEEIGVVDKETVEKLYLRP